MMSFNKKEFETPASDLELAVTKEVSAANKESSNCSKMAFTLLGAMLVAVCISQLYDGQNNVHDGVRSHVPTSRRLDGIPKDVEPTSNSPTANAEAREKAAAQALAEALKNFEAATQDEANARQEKDEAQHTLEGFKEAAEKADSAKGEAEAVLEKAKSETESAVESIIKEQGEQGGTALEVPSIAKERADEAKRICAQPVVSLELAPREVVVSLPGESGCLKSAGVGQQLIQNAQSGCARFEILKGSYLLGENLWMKQFRSLDDPDSCLDVFDGNNFKLSKCTVPLLCLTITTGTFDHDDGELTVKVNQGPEASYANYETEVSRWFSKGQTFNKCYTNLLGVEVESTNDWAGTISITNNGDDQDVLTHRIVAIGRTFSSGDRIAVHADSSGLSKARAYCERCQFYPSKVDQGKVTQGYSADFTSKVDQWARGSQAYTSKDDQWEVRHSSGKRVQALVGHRCSNLRDAEAAEKTAVEALAEAARKADLAKAVVEAALAKDDAEAALAKAVAEAAAKTKAEEQAAAKAKAEEEAAAKAKAEEEAAAKAQAEKEEAAKAAEEAARCVGPAECSGRSMNVCKREGKCTWTGVFHGCAGAAECLGKKEGVCKRMMEKEGKCQWIPKPSAEVLPKCSSLAGDKTNLKQTGKFCWHLKGRADLCATSYVSSSTNSFNKFIRMCRFEATTGKCKGDKLYCEP